MYKLFPTSAFLKKAKKVLNSDVKRNKFEKALLSLENDPFCLSLNTHKVQSRKYGLMFSSFISNDLRLIWTFDPDDRIVLLLLDIGGHAGSHKVYK